MKRGRWYYSQVCVFVDDHERQMLEAIARDQGVTMSAAIRMLVQRESARPKRERMSRVHVLVDTHERMELKALAKNQDLSMSSLVRMLVRIEANKRGLRPEGVQP